MPALELANVQLEVADGIAWATLDRPEALNAWTRQLADELRRALTYAEQDRDVRAVVISGAGRGFSSGADLKAVEPTGDGGAPDVLGLLRESYNPLILRVRSIPKPVIAAVHGPAAGIGCSLALACDLIVASESAYFLLAFANIGLALDGGASALLAARVGHARASEMALLARRIPAAQALEWGLVNRVVADDQLLDAAGELAAGLAAGPPGSYARIKRTLGEASFAGLAEMLELEARLQQELIETDDFREGVQAFLEKRPAAFKGV